MSVKSTQNQPFVILLVEDEKTDAQLVKWALAQNQVKADMRHAFDGYEALAFLRKQTGNFANAPRPDLILLDLNMPRMNGLECLAAIKQDTALSDIPVVILSTSYAESDVTAANALGAADYVSKPMDIHDLSDSIRRLAERWIFPVTHTTVNRNTL
ncbi:MAG: response regulator [Nitrosomonadales bacterium]|jgi:CheY-like chemotaxis protein